MIFSNVSLSAWKRNGRIPKALKTLLNDFQVVLNLKKYHLPQVEEIIPFTGKLGIDVSAGLDKVAVVEANENLKFEKLRKLEYNGFLYLYLS